MTMTPEQVLEVRELEMADRVRASSSRAPTWNGSAGSAMTPLSNWS